MNDTGYMSLMRAREIMRARGATDRDIANLDNWFSVDAGDRSAWRVSGFQAFVKAR